MAKTRKINNALIRIFDQSSSIVYLISDEFKLNYANEACAAWVGMELESLVGTNLVYTTEPLENEAENAAKGLSIAPNLISLMDAVDSLSIEVYSSKDSNLTSRKAIANAIYDHRGVLSGYLVVGSVQDQPPSDVDVRESLSTPAKLHNALMVVRGRHQKRFDRKQLVGTSAAADRVRRQLQSAADSDGDVLIVGPTGSGREHVARTVFAGSLAAPEDMATKLIPLHCSITDPTQIQSTMKELLNQQSDQATLLLIDVDQMDGGSQQELLGYLQLPGMSARMIATSSKKLIDPNSNFDQALASRLSTMTIELPPLSQRREDLPLLAQAILESRNDQQARQFSGFTRQAIEMICEYDWPENFGQLASAIEEAASNATGSIIQVADFSDTFQHSIKAQRFAPKEETTIDLEQYLLKIEEQLVGRAVAQAKGNKTKAAELLGISRAKLLRRLAVFQKAESGDAELLDPSVFKEEGATDDE